MTEVIDPKGDVLLCFPKADSGATNPDVFSLQVSSSVLCLASPVFSAMLNGPMAEGQAFRASASPRPFPLNLPGDHRAVFSILAKILHYQADRIPYLPSCAFLLALAKLVDKYACAGAVASHVEIWLQRAAVKDSVESPWPEFPGPINMRGSADTAAVQQDQDSNEDDSEYGSLLDRYTKLLLVAYVLDIPEQFARLSLDILLMHRQTLKDEIENGVELPIPPDHELLRHDLHGEITRCKARLRRAVHVALMDPVSRVTSLQYSNYYSSMSQALADPAATQVSQTLVSNLPGSGSATSPGELQSRPMCPNAARAIGNYMALLDLENLSPWRPQFETDSFKEIFTRAVDLVRRERHNPALLVQYCGRRPCECDHRELASGRGEHLMEKLAVSLGDPFNWPLRACLDCLKRGGRPEPGTGPGSTSCRIRHR